MGSSVLGLLNLTIMTTNWSFQQKRQDVLNSLLSQKYDSRIPPNFEDDFPTKVRVQLYILSFDSISESSMAYSMSVFLRQNWVDKRLQFSKANLSWIQRWRVGRLELDSKMMEKIWTPDLFFINEKEAVMHDVTVPNRLVHLYPNGTVQSSCRITLTSSCDMYLRNYPHDQQFCSTDISSYSYSADNVVFEWIQHNPVILRHSVTLPRFQVEFNGLKNCQFDINHGSMIHGVNFSCISAEFKLTRLFGYYVAQVYVPSILIVMLSWVSFWIDIDAIPARVSLGLLTVLTMTTHSTGVHSMLPRVSYIKAIDVWMAACLIFVFAALLEFAYVNVQTRVEKRRRESVMDIKQNKDRGVKSSDHYCLGSEEVNWNKGRTFVYLRDRIKMQRARMFDKISRVVFPILFGIFNVAYWLLYRM
ncbi:glycine receptor subunit alpha-2-like isoform X2 [Gigantopelta aegis]|uniref:glycine receptor subunit alpha-2-like isoform X2 n=1 Tax=Gigantopelta aegis TaxID=1735272 RepID=UPI001B88925D|nr:glycine receptor subunit alpha-2-like isoform X2 [Gigantopelta aegis]